MEAGHVHSKRLAARRRTRCTLPPAAIGVTRATAVILATVARRWRLAAASQVAIAVLALAGLKLVAQEVRSGAAATIFIAFAIYGSAMLAVARLRRPAAATSATG